MPVDNLKSIQSSNVLTLFSVFIWSCMVIISFWDKLIENHEFESSGVSLLFLAKSTHWWPRRDFSIYKHVGHLLTKFWTNWANFGRGRSDWIFWQNLEDVGKAKENCHGADGEATLQIVWRSKHFRWILANLKTVQRIQIYSKHPHGPVHHTDHFWRRRKNLLDDFAIENHWGMFLAVLALWRES